MCEKPTDFTHQFNLTLVYESLKHKNTPAWTSVVFTHNNLAKQPVLNL